MLQAVSPFLEVIFILQNHKCRQPDLVHSNPCFDNSMAKRVFLQMRLEILLFPHFTGNGMSRRPSRTGRTIDIDLILETVPVRLQVINFCLLIADVVDNAKLTVEQCRPIHQGGISIKLELHWN